MKNSIKNIDWHLIIGLSTKFSASYLFVFASPLFEEEGHFRSLALSTGKRKEHRPRMGQMFIEEKA